MPPSIEAIERSLISDRIRSYRRFLDSVEPHLEAVLQEWQAWVDAKAEGIRDEYERQEFYDSHSDEYFEHLEFRSILMSAFFSFCYARFEHDLVRICSKVQRRSKSPFSVQDISGKNVIDRCKKYLEKLGVPFSVTNLRWEETTKLQRLRNILMHEGGTVRTTKKNKSIIAYTKNHQIVSGPDETPHLELTRPFCEHALDNYREFLVTVHKDYETWLKEPNTQKNSTSA